MNVFVVVNVLGMACERASGDDETTRRRDDARLILARARSFSSVLLATTLAAKDSPVLGSCIEYTTAKPPLPRGLPLT